MTKEEGGKLGKGGREQRKEFRGRRKRHRINEDRNKGVERL